MTIKNVEVELDKIECTIKILNDDGVQEDIKSEELKYCYEDGSFYVDGIQFEDLELSEEAREYIDSMCRDFIYNLDEEDFAPADMR